MTAHTSTYKYIQWMMTKTFTQLRTYSSFNVFVIKLN